MSDRPSPLSWRDRLLGAAFTLAAVTAQQHWMGAATALLDTALVAAFLLWSGAFRLNDPARVLPVYLLGLVVQCLHFAEEFATGFQRDFPHLLGYEWSDARFVTFNMVWLALFLLAALGVHRRVSLAYLAVTFFALGGGIGNGAGHLLLCLRRGGYFPGAVTAPLCLLLGILLIHRLFTSPAPVAAQPLPGPATAQPIPAAAAPPATSAVSAAATPQPAPTAAQPAAPAAP
jgi:hypothetical protein